MMKYLLVAAIAVITALGFVYQSAVPHLKTWISSGYDITVSDFELAASGHPPAITKLGDLYYANQEFSQAALYYQQASDRGEASAMMKLSKMYKSGIGVSQDRIKAGKLLLEATQSGHPEALKNIGKEIQNMIGF